MLAADINLSKEHLEFITQVGEGGYGEVWKGRWNGSGGGITVAIKKIKVSGINPQAQKVIFSEVEILSKLRHPNIVTIYGACLSQQELWIVMEFMEGGSLFDLLHSDVELGWDTRARLAHQAAIGVNVLHSREKFILHRDIKSLNFLVSKDNSIVKLTDFGMSKVNSFATSIIATGREAIGTIRWAAPETFGGANWTTKADIYSLGVTIYEIASRAIPFQDIPDNMRVMFQVHNLKARPEIPSDCPQDIADLIDDCWHNDPDQRPTALALVSSLATLASKYAPQTQDAALKSSVLSFALSSTNVSVSSPTEITVVSLESSIPSPSIPPSFGLASSFPSTNAPLPPHVKLDAPIHAISISSEMAPPIPRDYAAIELSSAPPSLATEEENFQEEKRKSLVVGVAVYKEKDEQKDSGEIDYKPKPKAKLASNSMVDKIRRFMFSAPATPPPPPLTAADLPSLAPDSPRFSRISHAQMFRSSGIELTANLPASCNLTTPSLICYNPNDNSMYTYDMGYIRKVPLSGETISTISNFLEGIQDICINIKENAVYATSAKKHVIFKISLSEIYGNFVTFAGKRYGYKDGENTNAHFAGPQGITVDQQTGVLYVADSGNKAIRMITPQGTVSTIVVLEFAPYGISFCEKYGFLLVTGNGRVCIVALEERTADVVRTGDVLGTAIMTSQGRILYFEPSGPHFCTLTKTEAGGYRLKELTNEAGLTFVQLYNSSFMRLGKLSRALVCVESKNACFVCSDEGIHKIQFVD